MGKTVEKRGVTMEALKGKTILITEAGEGIGKEILLELLSHQDMEKVIVVSEEPEALIKQIEELQIKKEKMTVLKGERYEEKTLKKVFENTIDYIIDTPKELKEKKEKRPDEIIAELSHFPLFFDYINKSQVKKYLLVSTAQIIKPITLEASEKALKEKIVMATNEPENSKKAHCSAIRIAKTSEKNNAEIVLKALELSQGGEIFVPLYDDSEKKTDKELFTMEEGEKSYKDTQANFYIIIPDMKKYGGEKEACSNFKDLRN